MINSFCLWIWVKKKTRYIGYKYRISHFHWEHKTLGIFDFDLDYTGLNFENCSYRECLAFAASFVKGH